MWLALMGLGLSMGAGPYGLPVGLPMGIPAKDPDLQVQVTCSHRSLM